MTCKCSSAKSSKSKPQNSESSLKKDTSKSADKKSMK